MIIELTKHWFGLLYPSLVEIKATTAVAAVPAASNCDNVITVASQHLFSEENSLFFRCVIIANVAVNNMAFTGARHQ